MFPKIFVFFLLSVTCTLIVDPVQSIEIEQPEQKPNLILITSPSDEPVKIETELNACKSMQVEQKLLNSDIQFSNSLVKAQAEFEKSLERATDKCQSENATCHLLDLVIQANDKYKAEVKRINDYYIAERYNILNSPQANIYKVAVKRIKPRTSAGSDTNETPDTTTRLPNHEIEDDKKNPNATKMLSDDDYKRLVEEANRRYLTKAEEVKIDFDKESKEIYKNYSDTRDYEKYKAAIGELETKYDKIISDVYKTYKEEREAIERGNVLKL